MSDATKVNVLHKLEFNQHLRQAHLKYIQDLFD